MSAVVLALTCACAFGYLPWPCRYKQALGLFVYITCAGEWRKGIKDEQVTKHVNTGDPASPDGQATTRLLVTLYNNIAACHMELKQFSVAVQACGDALRIDDTNAIALFRRSRARMAHPGAGNAELDAAIVDLQTAIRAHPTNEGVASQLRKLKGMRKRQRKQAAAQFGGLFERGEVVAGKGAVRPSARDAKAAPSPAAGGTGDAPTGDAGVAARKRFEKQLNDLERVAQEWEQAGKREQAAELREHLAQVRQ